MTKPVYRMRPDEALVAGAVYLCALIPLWGIVFGWTVRESWRQRSRQVEFHATQAVWLQVGLLLAFVVYACVQLVANVLHRMHPNVSEALSAINLGVMALLTVIYAIACLASAWTSLEGKTLLLPLIGRRLHSQEYEED